MVGIKPKIPPKPINPETPQPLNLYTTKPLNPP
jgi:hypothetical protein